MSRPRSSSDEAFSFITGLIAGFIISAPVAAWLSPRSGEETRHAITQQGMIIRRQVGHTLRQPVDLIQSQLEQFKGDSVQDALEEGKSIAAQRQPY